MQTNVLENVDVSTRTNLLMFITCNDSKKKDPIIMAPAASPDF